MRGGSPQERFSICTKSPGFISDFRYYKTQRTIENSYNHMTQNLFESIYKRLLFESSLANTENLAACVFPEEGTYEAVLYNVENAKKHLTSSVLRELSPEILIQFKITVGMIQIAKPPTTIGRCYDAWEVVTVAGPGYGDILYAIAYALSPSKLLILDRSSVSDKAYTSWRRESGGREKFPLDDFDDPKTVPTVDDCTVYKDERSDVLDHAYKAQEWEKSMLAQLRGNHAKFVREMERKTPSFDQEDFLNHLKWSSVRFFREKFLPKKRISDDY